MPKTKNNASKAVQDVTRYIAPEVERELWARAAGRCEFNGCNKLLYKSPLTQEKVNLAEKAHIYSFSPNGPRGWGPTTKDQLNELPNLILVCHDCHHTIDQDKDGQRYSATLLKEWKAAHENRVVLVTGINPRNKSHVVLYKANIGEQATRLREEDANHSLFPDWYPAEERATHISMSWEGKDNDPNYWSTEVQNLKTAFQRQVSPLIEAAEPNHLSVFAFAPIPLLVKLGSLMNDMVAAQVYQLHREPEQTWRWLDSADGLVFEIKPPKAFVHPPALIISLSDSIAHERITSVLGDNVSVWELTLAKPHNDFLKSKAQLSQFRKAARWLMVEIGKAHGKTAPLTIFPAMPVACAIELGRIRMPKADNPWVIYDQNHKHRKFIRALEIGSDHD